MAESLARLGSAIVRFRVAVILFWVVAAAIGAVVGGGVFDRTVDLPDSPAGSESDLADQRLDELAPEGEIVTAVISGADFFDPVLRDAATSAMHELREVPGVADVVDAYTANGIISDDGRSSLVVVELDPALAQDDALAVADVVAERLRAIPAPDVLVGGELVGEREFADTATTDAAVGEGIALIILVALLTCVLGRARFGLAVAAVGVIAIAVALLGLRGIAAFAPVNDFAINIVTILGLGLIVDSALLMLFRFRDERERDPASELAVLMSRTVKHAGRSVIFSVLVMGVALAGMLVLGDPLLEGMAAGGLVSVLVAALAGLTLVPAVIAVMGHALPERGERTWARPWAGRSAGTDRSRWDRVTAFAQRRPVAVTAVSIVLLGVLAAPVGGLVLGGSDVRALPADSEPRQTQELISTEFGDVSFDTVTVIATGDETDEEVRDLFRAIAALPEAADVSAYADDLPAGVTVLEFEARGEATGAEAQSLVREIRDFNTDIELQVTGPAAHVVDTIDHLSARLPFAIGGIAVATFGVLFWMTRSLIVPLKAILMNVAVMAATLGVLTAVFAWGWGEKILGFDSWGGLDVTTPLMIGILSFGLAMDYEVFLLARIHEDWRGGSGAKDSRRNAMAVRSGLRRSAPVISAAGAAIAVVFLGLAVGSIQSMKEAGIGLLVAVVLDVTVVRLFLLPAAMTLLGRWNWWPGGESHEPTRIGPAAVTRGTR